MRSTSGKFVISIRRIQKTVAAFYNVGLIDLRSHRRTQPVTFYRQIAMYLCKELTTNSLPVIGRQFGGRDHTTVLHAWRKVAPMRADPDFDTQMRGLISLIMAGGPDAGGARRKQRSTVSGQRSDHGQNPHH